MSEFEDLIASTTSVGSGYQNLTLENLRKMVEDFKPSPTIYAMDYTMVVNDYLENNTIVISKDLAKKLGVWDK